MTLPMDDAPSWFTDAVAAPYRIGEVRAAGASVRYLDWGGAGSMPGLVFVHGGAAHAHWWSFLAPLLTDRWHPVALDLTGHGDSARRSRYSHETWAEEVMAVAGAAELSGPPVVVGHSLGGLVAIQCGFAHGDELAGAVVVDTPVRRPDPESEEGARGSSFRAPGVYPDLETALSHYRLIPDQPVTNRFVFDHVARHSLARTSAGWTWKFDPALFRHTMVSMRDQLLGVGCRIALFRGEHSVVVPPDTAEYMSELLQHTAPVVSIAEAHHHLILDQPLAFVAALRTLLVDWDHASPAERRPLPA